MPALVLLLETISGQDEKVAGPFAAARFPRCRDLTALPLFFSLYKFSSPPPGLLQSSTVAFSTVASLTISILINARRY